MDFQVPPHILPHLYVFYIESNITAVEMFVQEWLMYRSFNKFTDNEVASGWVIY